MRLRALPPARGPGDTAPSWWRRRVVTPVMGQLTQGTTPDKLAESITVAVVIGVLPVVGVTTVLCALAGWRMRLNQPVLQLVNGLLYPVQLFLLIPFASAGEAFFGTAAISSAAPHGVLQLLLEKPWHVADHYGTAVLYGVVVWAVVAPPVGIALHLALKPLLQGVAQRLATANAQARRP